MGCRGPHGVAVSLQFWLGAESEVARGSRGDGIRIADGDGGGASGVGGGADGDGGGFPGDQVVAELGDEIVVTKTGADLEGEGEEFVADGG